MKRISIKRILATTLAGIALVLLSPRPLARALDSTDIAISVTPVSQTLDLYPGREYHEKISIYNSGYRKFTFTVSASPYQVDSETYDPIFSTVNSYTQIANWITFEQDTYEIEPATYQEVNFTINVPEDAVGGGQYAVILARTEDSKDEGAAIQVISQVASILYGRVNGSEMRAEGELVEQRIPGFLIDSPLTVAAKVYNTGNVDYRLSQDITITDAFSGNEVLSATATDTNGQPLAANTTVVLPGTARENVITWANSPRLGVYRVKQHITFLDQELETEQLVFFCPLWLIISVIILIAAIVLAVVLMLRHRKRQQPQIF